MSPRQQHGSLRAVRGLSLIELMIAMVLGLILTSAAIVLFSTNRLTYTTAESMGRMQESIRTSFELMSRDLREAGGNVCDASLPMTNGLVTPTANWWSNWNNGLLGYGPTTAFPDAAFGTAAGNRVTGTEAIELKYGEIPFRDNIAPSGVAVTADMTNANLNTAIPVSATAALTVNDLLIACDYSGATIFKATALSGTAITHAAGTGASDNLAAALLIAPHGNGKNGLPLPGLAINGSIAKLRASRWYVGCNGRFACNLPGGQSLFQSTLRNNAGTLSVPAEEIAQGVSNMSVLYLPAGGAAYVAAAAVTNWPAVSAVKVTLTVAGTDRVGTDGQPISRTVEHVVSLRNHLP